MSVIGYVVKNQPIVIYFHFLFEELMNAPIFAVPKRTGV